MEQEDAGSMHWEACPSAYLPDVTPSFLWDCGEVTNSTLKE